MGIPGLVFAGVALWLVGTRTTSMAASAFVFIAALAFSAWMIPDLRDLLRSGHDEELVALVAILVFALIGILARNLLRRRRAT